MTGPDRRDVGRVFNEVPELYDRVRPAYPDELFADLVAITGMGRRSPVLEVGCGTGQATRSLAALGCSVTAVEPGAGMAALARLVMLSRIPSSTPVTALIGIATSLRAHKCPSWRSTWVTWWLRGSMTSPSTCPISPSVAWTRSPRRT